jgi:PmbA protein
VWKKWTICTGYLWVAYCFGEKTDSWRHQFLIADILYQIRIIFYMTTQDKYNLVQWAIEFALKQGAQEAAAVISDSESYRIEIREQKIDRLEQASQQNLSVRLYVDHKFSEHTTNRLNKDSLKRFISEAVAATRFLSEDEFRTLPDPELCYKGGGPKLNSVDKNYHSVDPQRKIDLAYAVEREVLGMDERIISASTSYADGVGGRILAASNGFRGDTANSYFSLGASVSVMGDGARPSSGWSESAIFLEKLTTSGIGQTALKRALSKIGQRKIESARMPMIVENISAARMLSPLIAALNGSAIQQKNSFLIDKLNEQVASNALTITDDPFIKDGRASRLFDGEGLAVRKMPVFEKGLVKNYYIDSYYARKLGVSPTTGSTSNLILSPGTRSLEQMVASLGRGILVTGFNGGNSNGTTGDFSFGIDGFLIESGVVVQPVSEMNITGNMMELWMNFAEAGNDFREDSAWRLPSLLFNEVDFSGI